MKDRNMSELTRWREGRKAEFSALVVSCGYVQCLVCVNMNCCSLSVTRDATH